MDARQDTPFRDPAILGTLKDFKGVSNISPEERTGLEVVRTLDNFDVDTSGALLASYGTTLLTSGVWGSLWANSNAEMFAVKDGHLVKVAANGTPTQITASVGTARMAFLTLPDGNTVYMNGTVAGTILAGTATARACGIPRPASAGSAANTTGSLNPGTYRWAVTYKRNTDGEEGGAAFPTGVVTVTTGGVAITGLPSLAGYTINVYLSSHNDDALYFAGNTATTTFTASAANHTLVTPLKTAYLAPPPVGTQLAFYRGRMLVVEGNVVWASQPFQYELFDFRKDFKLFPTAVAFVQPIDDGVYVGAADGVYFMSGDKFDTLTLKKVSDSPAMAYSAVGVSGEHIRTTDGAAAGIAAVFVADGSIFAGLAGGRLVELTGGKFRVPETTCTGASFYVQRDVPMYVLHAS